MSSCEKLRTGQDSSCATIRTKYYQQAVLVNRQDLLNFRIETSSVSILDEYICKHRVYFDLAEGTTGYMFKVGDTASYIMGVAEKVFEDGIPQYKHIVSVAVIGVTEDVKCLLTQLDYADYFAALQFADGTIEIFGFEYGLGTNDYRYAPGETGGALITLRSLADSPEDELPFVYFSGTEGGENEDFDNLFADNVYSEAGDFNDDFNDDFDNGS